MYNPAENRYSSIAYKRCGASGLKLPSISLGLWQNFGEKDALEKSKKVIFKAFDCGITHFDLANNYGPPPGSAEETFGKILKSDLMPWRDEMIVSTKAGYTMWPGPYGDFGSRKYLLASLDQSLKRMGLEYVDIFYSHRVDPETPLEETMGALTHAVRQGKALYAGISNYPPEIAARAFDILRDNGTPCLIHQPRYSILAREPEKGLFELLLKSGVGSIVFSPLAQGMLTDKYLGGIPEDSRIGKGSQFLRKESITPELLAKIQALNEIAKKRGQTLAQMALTWVARQRAVTTVLIGASTPQQIEENLAAMTAIPLSDVELAEIDKIAPVA